MFRISAPSYMSKRLPLTTDMYSSTTLSDPRGPRLNLHSNFLLDDRTVRPTSRAECEMAKAREAWSRKNWTGSLLCNSRQGGRGRGPRTPAYSCGRGRWRYCIHFSFAGRAGLSGADEKLQTSRANYQESVRSVPELWLLAGDRYALKFAKNRA